MLGHVPHCQDHLPSLKGLFSFFYDESGMVPRKMNRSQLFTPSLIGKSDMQLKHCNGSIIKIKMELRKGRVYWGVKPKHNRKWQRPWRNVMLTSHLLGQLLLRSR